MKKLIILIVSLILSISFVTASFAQGQPELQNPDAQELSESKVADSESQTADSYVVSENGIITLDDLLDAREVINAVAVKTELVKVEGLTTDDVNVYLKLENEQPVKSFKIRGAYYMISKLSEDELARGVITCSAGNHAQGVALSSSVFGCKATIYVPASTPQVKKDKIQGYENVEMVAIEGSFDDAKSACMEEVSKGEKIYIPPYDHADIIAGQGTVGLEILEQLETADAVVVPVGGGGLAAGISAAIKYVKPECRVIAVEPEEAASMNVSIKEGHPVEIATANTIADGTAVKKPGDLTFEICKNCVDDFVTVSEEEIEKAIAYLYNTEGVTAEGAGALSVAAVMTGKIPAECKNVVCVVSGGNIDPALLEEILGKY